MSVQDNLPKAGCRTITDEQFEALLQFAKQKKFTINRETDYFNGFLAGLCFLGVDEWESEYGLSFDKFFEEAFMKYIM